MRKRRKKNIRMELTSLTDIVFLLLLFFMLSTTLIKEDKGLEIKLPEAKGLSQQQEDEKNTTIEISKSGEIVFNGMLVSSIAKLEEELNSLQAKSPDEMIVIKADEKINYGLVVKVMGLCKSKKFNRLGMSALEDSMDR
ncbi:MAG: biopolymer transporter ExbD [bacterium]